MVATTDCVEKSRPMAGKKVRTRGGRFQREKLAEMPQTDMKFVCYINFLTSYLFLFHKVSKPLMEKKRRARINKCLDQLKVLLESYYSTSVSVQAFLLELNADRCNWCLIKPGIIWSISILISPQDSKAKIGKSRYLGADSEPLEEPPKDPALWVLISWLLHIHEPRVTFTELVASSLCISHLNLSS